MIDIWEGGRTYTWPNRRSSARLSSPTKETTSRCRKARVRDLPAAGTDTTEEMMTRDRSRPISSRRIRKRPCAARHIPRAYAAVPSHSVCRCALCSFRPCHFLRVCCVIHPGVSPPASMMLATILRRWYSLLERISLAIWKRIDDGGELVRMKSCETDFQNLP